MEDWHSPEAATFVRKYNFKQLLHQMIMHIVGLHAVPHHFSSPNIS